MNLKEYHAMNKEWPGQFKMSTYLAVTVNQGSSANISPLGAAH
jgi:hypothetical protein